MKRVFQNHKPPRTTAAASAKVFCLCLFSLSVAATTILKMDFEEVVNKSELIFQGEAIAKTVRQVKGGQPMTFVKFRIDEVVKGDYQKPTIELGFLGDETGGKMRIQGLNVPAVGEAGIYFVESTAGLFINPLYGWHQGHYIVETDAAGRRSIRRSDATAAEYDRKGRTVREADAARKQTNTDASKTGADDTGAESLTDFKQRIRSILNQ